ncbi:hypothetical protein HMPREF9413_5778 [Paenibacillus sp. HGF7]|nr:hypothetical protein HMPREF9413_5778 [Paenibacillus sp. HGF7]
MYFYGEKCCVVPRPSSSSFSGENLLLYGYVQQMEPDWFRAVSPWYNADISSVYLLNKGVGL